VWSRGQLRRIVDGWDVHVTAIEICIWENDRGGLLRIQGKRARHV
jgi:hypothetical protein